MGIHATFVDIQAKLGQENLLTMVRLFRWHFTPDTGFEIQTLAVWAQTARHSFEYLLVNVEETCFVSLKAEYQSVRWIQELRRVRQAMLTTTPGPQPEIDFIVDYNRIVKYTTCSYVISEIYIVEFRVGHSTHTGNNFKKYEERNCACSHKVALYIIITAYSNNNSSMIYRLCFCVLLMCKGEDPMANLGE